MKLQSPHLKDYLKASSVIDHDHPAIIAQANELIDHLESDIAKARTLFEWVRDEIPHSWDIGAGIVTCSASEVLDLGTGICYAKSHLLAALLRTSGIPAGFCYQALCRDAPYEGMCLHGLNALYLGSIDRWVRVDPRGNTNGIDAQFDIEQEQLAFPVREELEELTYDEIFADPAEEVVAVLQSCDDLEEMWPHLPGPWAQNRSAVSPDTT